MGHEGVLSQRHPHASPREDLFSHLNGSPETLYHRRQHGRRGQFQSGRARSPAPINIDSSRLPLVHRRRSRGRSSEKALTRRPGTSSSDRSPAHPRERRKYSDASSPTPSDIEEQRKKRNEKLFATSMACITTIAAANNIYQSTKAHETRRKEVHEGRMSLDEAHQKRRKHLMLDLFSVGVAAVGINNARNGWKRVENCGQ